MTADDPCPHATVCRGRGFLDESGVGLAALASLLGRDADAADKANPPAPACRTSRRRRSGSSTCSSPARPSQIDLFDHKPKLDDLRGTELPDSIRKGQRLTGMTAGQASFPVAPSHVQVRPARPERAPGSASCCRTRRRSPTSCASSSRCTPRRSTTTRRSPSSRPAHQLAGRPSIGAWLTYGLGSENQDLPAFVVLISQGTGNPTDQPLYDRLWGSGFLPSQYQGVKFRSVGDPVLYLSNPPGVDDRDAAGACSTTWPSSTSCKLERDRRPGDRHAHRPVRDGLPHADRRCRS